MGEIRKGERIIWMCVWLKLFRSEIWKNLGEIVKRNEELYRNRRAFDLYGNCANVDVRRERERKRERERNNLKRENIYFNNGGRKVDLYSLIGNKRNAIEKRVFFSFLFIWKIARIIKFESSISIEKIIFRYIATRIETEKRVFCLDNLFLENKLSEGGLTHYEKPINVKQ